MLSKCRWKKLKITFFIYFDVYHTRTNDPPTPTNTHQHVTARAFMYWWLHVRVGRSLFLIRCYSKIDCFLSFCQKIDNFAPFRRKSSIGSFSAVIGPILLIFDFLQRSEPIFSCLVLRLMIQWLWLPLPEQIWMWQGLIFMFTRWSDSRPLLDGFW